MKVPVMIGALILKVDTLGNGNFEVYRQYITHIGKGLLKHLQLNGVQSRVMLIHQKNVR
jgi:hypothetical protein